MAGLPEEAVTSFAGRRVLVTGGTGMVGRALVPKLLAARAARVCVVSMDDGDDVPDDPRVEFWRLDLRQLRECRNRVMDGHQDVFHLAGVKGSVRAMGLAHAVPLVVNLQVTTNVLDAAMGAGVERLVYTSTVGAYAPSSLPLDDDDPWDGNPMDHWAGWAKRMGELQIDAYRRDGRPHADRWRIARLTNVYGPGDTFDPVTGMVVGALMARIAGGERPLKVQGDGRAVRDFLFSEDAAEGLMALMAAPEAPWLVNLGGGVERTIADLVGLLADTWPNAGHDRVTWEFTGGADGWGRRTLAIEAAKALGWEPRTPLAVGLARTWAWYLANREAHARKKDWLK